MKKIISIFLILLFIFSFASCSSSSSSADSEYDYVMAGQDWGDDYYYDSNDNVVREKLW